MFKYKKGMIAQNPDTFKLLHVQEYLSWAIYSLQLMTDDTGIAQLSYNV